METGNFESWVCVDVAYLYSRAGHQNLTLNSGTETICKYRTTLFSEGDQKSLYAIFGRYLIGNPFSFDVDIHSFVWTNKYLSLVLTDYCMS